MAVTHPIVVRHTHGPVCGEILLIGRLVALSRSLPHMPKDAAPDTMPDLSQRSLFSVEGKVRLQPYR